jgi:hypothetical protein
MRTAPDRAPIQLPKPAAGVIPADPPGIAAALAWIGDEYDNLCATQHLAAEHGWDDAVWQLAWSMDNYHHRLGRAQDEVAVWEAGLAAAERLSRPGPLIAALRLMSSTYVKVGNHAAGIACLQRALCLAEAAGDLLEQARIHHAFGFAWDEQGDLRNEAGTLERLGASEAARGGARRPHRGPGGLAAGPADVRAAAPHHRHTTSAPTAGRMNHESRQLLLEGTTRWQGLASDMAELWNPG